MRAHVRPQKKKFSSSVRIGSALCAAAFLLAGCGSDDKAAGPQVRKTPVTIARAEARRVEVLERSVGRLEAPGTPAIAAETAGRVAEIRVDAGQSVEAGALLARLDDEVQSNAERVARASMERVVPMLENQVRTVERARDMMSRNLAAQSTLDEAVAQHDALKAQLAESQARLDEAVRNLEQTRVLSPVTGVVQNRHISVGDFVNIGQPLFDIVVADRMRAVAPFPESVGDKLRVGQKAYVSPVRTPEDMIETTITELKPQIGVGSRSADVILEFENPGRWRSGASITVAVVIDARDNSVTVPSESIVRRPAGTVVYVVEEGIAHQRVVEVGVQSGTWVEIMQGLEAGEPVAQSGAGFLTEGAPVEAKSVEAKSAEAESAEAESAEAQAPEVATE